MFHVGSRILNHVGSRSISGRKKCGTEIIVDQLYDTEWFTEQLRDLAHNVKIIITANVPMVDFDYEKFNSATHCHVYKKSFAPDDTRVRVHCHLTDQCRGSAHSNCNLNYRDSHYIPIVFHNISSYYAHFIVKEIATGTKDK